MPTPFVTTRRVEFRDTDAAGIAHFSVYFNYMEAAEHEFLRSLGTSVLSRDAQGEISWPRVAVSCEYRGAIRFEDIIEIQLRIERLGEKSVSYLFSMTKSGLEVARGKITAVCCRIEHGQPPKSMPIPAALAEQLAAFVI